MKRLLLFIALAILMSGCEPEGDSDDPFTPDFDHLTKVMQLDREHIVQWLGKDYVKGESDPTGIFPRNGMYYEKYWISIVFNAAADKPSTIFCNDKVDIRGAKQKMKFSEIENILGKGEEVSPVDFGMYAEVYKFDPLGVSFGAYDRESLVIEVKIFNWVDLYGT